MNSNRVGKQSVIFHTAPRILTSAAIAGDMEGEGPIGTYFDMILEDDTWGEDSWEKAERKMYIETVKIACDKAKCDYRKLDCLLGGDLLNQIISANFAARDLGTPYLGLYGACSTMSESLLCCAMLTDGGYLTQSACIAGSHFSTAERQFRFPLELGSQNTATAQRTVTGTGCAIVVSGDNEQKSSEKNSRIYNTVHIVGGTIGKVVDMGITDSNNMGAAMAPAAVSTFTGLLADFNKTADDFDLIVTGDLGRLGGTLFCDMCAELGVDVRNKYLDCGNIVFAESQKVDCGGSGCGCSAVTLCGYLLKRMEEGDFKNAVFMATGALLSPTSTFQGESIPGIAHAIILERR